MMGNHGLLSIGESAAAAFDAFYHFERAARTLMLAYGTRRKLNVLNDQVAEKTALAWESEPEFGDAHFAQMRLTLDQDYLN